MGIPARRRDAVARGWRGRPKPPPPEPLDQGVGGGGGVVVSSVVSAGGGVVLVSVGGVYFIGGADSADGAGVSIDSSVLQAASDSVTRCVMEVTSGLKGGCGESVT